MATLNPLIKAQELDIDDHRWGSGQPSEWGGGYHIHKRFLEKRRKGIEIRIPIDRNHPVDISGADTKTAIKVMREIKAAFEDTNTRAQFADDLADAFNAITRGRGRVGVIRRATRRIVRHFGLDPGIIDEVAESYRGKTFRYFAVHRDAIDKTVHYLVLRENRLSISGESSYYEPFPWYWKYFK